MSEYLDVCMVLYRSDSMALQALTHLIAYTPVPLRFILVDNGGGSGRHLLRWLPEVQCVYIANPENVGYYAAMNQCLGLAESEHVIIAAPDHFVLPRWFEPLGVALEHFGLRWASPDWRTGPYDRAVAWEALAADSVEIELGRASTSCALIDWAKLKEEIGYFDERFFLTHGDTDYLERMRDKELRCGIVRGIMTHHDEHGARKWNTAEDDTAMEIADGVAFAAKWADRPDVTARHPPLDPDALRQIKRTLWDEQQ